MCGISWQRAETATYQRLYIGSMTDFLCGGEKGRRKGEMEVNGGIWGRTSWRCKLSYGSEVEDEMQMVVM